MMPETFPPTIRRPGHITVRNRYLAVRINLRVLGMCLLTLAIGLGVCVFAMTLGSYNLTFQQVFDGVLGKGDDKALFVVRDLRLPRVLVALLVGSALAMSGGIFQGLVRNPLVSPDIIGINTGATLVAVVMIAYGMSQALLPAAAFTGAILTAGVIYGLSWRNGIVPSRLILVGIGIGAFLTAATTWVTLQFPIERIRPAIVWTMGSVYASTWKDVRLLAACLVILVPLGIILMWYLRVLQLGDDIGRGLGMHLELTRFALILVGCGLAAIAVSIAGPIGFVALMVPHAARMLAGPLSGSVLVFTALLGATYLVSADVVAQHLLPVDMPVGVVTSALGAPYFLFLLYKSNARV